MAAYSSEVSLEPQVAPTTVVGLRRSLGCLNCCCRLAPSAPPSDRLATHLSRTLTFRGDRSAIHPAHELPFDIRKQHEDSDAQR